jgi:hypothetical protein
MASPKSKWRNRVTLKVDPWRDRLAHFDALPQLAFWG